MRLAVLAAAAVAAGCAANPSESPAPVKLIDTKVDTVGAPIRYPEGTAHVSSYVLTLVPGKATGWHRHDVPLYAHVLSGALTVDYGPKGSKTYRTGDTLMEAMDIWHNGHAIGDEPARLLIVFMGSDGAKNTVMRK